MVDAVTIALTVLFWGSFGALLLCACCIVRYSMRWNNAANQNQQNAVGPAQYCQKNDSLHEKLIKQFKDSLKMLKTTDSQPQSDVKRDEGCPICFDEYAGAPQEVFIGYIKKCGHYFHFDCIWKWLEARGSCPLCREHVQLAEEDIKGFALSQVPRCKSVCTMTDPVLGLSSVESQTEGNTPSSMVTILVGTANENNDISCGFVTEGVAGQRSVGLMTDSSANYGALKPPASSKQCSCGQANNVVVAMEGTDNPAFEDSPDYSCVTQL